MKTCASFDQDSLWLLDWAQHVTNPQVLVLRRAVFSPGAFFCLCQAPNSTRLLRSAFITFKPLWILMTKPIRRFASQRQNGNVGYNRETFGAQRARRAGSPILERRKVMSRGLVLHTFCLALVASLLALPGALLAQPVRTGRTDRKSTRLNSSHLGSSYA